MSESARVTIPRHHVWRVVDMPGLSRIELPGYRDAVLVFESAEHVTPPEPEFVLNEVRSMLPMWCAADAVATSPKDRES